MSSKNDPVLSVNSLCVSFGGLVAVQNVSFEIYSNTVTVLVGKNGCGKTSLLNALSGFVPATGMLKLGSCDVTSLLAWQRVRMGIARTFQIPRVFDRLSEEERQNIRVGRSRGVPRNAISRALSVCSTLRIPRLIDGEHETNSNESNSVAVRELEYILSASPKVVLLDEPFSGIGREERDQLSIKIRILKDSGCALIVVEHQLDAAMQLADSVLELDQGTVVFLGSRDEFNSRKQGN